MGRRPGVAPLPAAVVLVVTAAAVAWVAHAGGGYASAGAAGTWERAPTPPLGPRERAVGVWTGREAIVVGGAGPPFYPPDWDGPTVEPPPLRDGAAFDPRTASWRSIAPAAGGCSFRGSRPAGGSSSAEPPRWA